MTIGQRIAQKRKELGLSQEALGEQLSVSRQSIYKWESDAALPEIDKLIALSRLFEVSVGWLLGVEESGSPQQDSPETTAQKSSDELSDTQLKMVEEIVERYLAAQPLPRPRKKWPWILLCLIVLMLSFHLINRLDQIDQQYQRVQMTVSNVQHSVNSQISGITTRVEEVLKSQNALTAEYGAEISATDLAKNQIRFSVYAVPKTYVEGMEVQFSADSHTGDINKVTGEEDRNHKFTAAPATELTDNITLSVTFIYPDGTHETQVLGTYTYLYSETLPRLSIIENLWDEELTPEGTLQLPSPFNTLRYVLVEAIGNTDITELKNVRVGLFKNQELVVWGTPCEAPENYTGFEETLFFEFPTHELPLLKGDTVCFAAVITDPYDRTFVTSGPLFTPEPNGDTIRLTHANEKQATEWIY